MHVQTVPQLGVALLASAPGVLTIHSPRRPPHETPQMPHTVSQPTAQLTDVQVAQVETLFDTTFGVGVAAASDVRKAHDRSMLLATLAPDTQDVIAAVLFDTHWTPGTRERVFEVDQLADGSHLLDLIAVHPQWRHQGVGAALLDAALHHMQQVRKAPVATWAWRSDADESYPLFASRGFIEHGTFEAVFAYESHVHGYQCVQCGPPPCTCTATFMLQRTD